MKLVAWKFSWKKLNSWKQYYVGNTPISGTSYTVLLNIRLGNFHTKYKLNSTDIIIKVLI